LESSGIADAERAAMDLELKSDAAAPRRGLPDRISVVLLTYNCIQRIETITDQLRQLGVPLIVVDNASTDGTADWLQGTDLDVVLLPDNLGAAARNAGVQRVRTPCVAFCDDDEWYEPGGLAEVCDLFDAHPRLALVNAKIVVGPQRRTDPISVEMAESPIPETDGIPGTVLMGFMAGACVFRVSAYRQIGGYDARFFISGEEESLAFDLIKHGWRLRYVPSLVVAHYPSLANFGRLRPYNLRNTLWAAWLHRRFLNAVRYTAFVLADAPKTITSLRGLGLALAGLPWILRQRQPMDAELDADLRLLDRRRFAHRRPLLTFRDQRAANPPTWQAGEA
jgi:GT2 family glycosyltransferase